MSAEKTTSNSLDKGKDASWACPWGLQAVEAGGWGVVTSS